MTLSQTLTLSLGLALAAFAAGWAIVEVRRGSTAERLVLVAGPPGNRRAQAAFASVAVAVVLMIAVFALRLVPRGAPLVYAVTLVWITVACVASIIARNAIQIRRSALGSITLIGKDKLRIDAYESTSEFTLVPGSVRLYLVDGAPGAAQFVITEGSHIVTVWGTISPSGLKDVTQDTPLKPQGFMIAGSAEELRIWLAPFITT